MKKQDPGHIVCLALPAWEADYLRSTVELMKGLSATNLVLYVDYAYTISDCIKGILGKKKFEWKRLLGINKRLRKISGDDQTGLYVLSLPPVFPSFIIRSYTFFKLANRLNAAFTGYFINRAIKRLQLHNIIAFNSVQPFLGLYWKIKHIDYKIYYIYDDFTNVPWFKGFASKEENKFIQQADLIVVSSDELKKRKEQSGIPTEVVNNGVHFDAFYRYAKKNTTETKEAKTIGYTGTMDFRFDIDLLEPVVKDLPQHQFLFIGKVFEPEIRQRLSKYKNVTFMPPVSSDQVPLIQSRLDVGIIPYVCNDLTAAIYPLKANEYLAMGLPVVMTPFATIGEADDVVFVAKDPKAFINDIKNALSGNNDALIQKRIEVAKKADWSARSAQLMAIIEIHTAAKIDFPVVA
ncbi:glycosyltransferase [Mucilaginibacter gotjawali]|uniref:Uncharacterized protein n=2 Tax=Mucilaginibacter gotjawali TaxID=1550579 RepID=A0A839SKW5_9SPHI|nr:glycosyltransferase [Mucilaginibacter gotjawali]MBB3058152.1 hypothetical protein [Mucilaginibacter gotjawali]BAU54893.1 putative teichuronic acid biosynthesis glycosyltransferase TuaH [Mucilaginibacter gotjawali]